LFCVGKTCVDGPYVTTNDIRYIKEGPGIIEMVIDCRSVTPRVASVSTYREMTVRVIGYIIEDNLA
jgi:hypothetical protein